MKRTGRSSKDKILRRRSPVLPPKRSLPSPGESSFHTLVEDLPTAIFVVQQTRLVYANAEAASVMGYSRAEMIGLDLSQLIHPDFRKLVTQRTLERQRGENPPAHLEVLAVRKNGEERWLDVRSQQIVFRGKAASLTSAVDITDQKRIDAMLRESEERFRTVWQQSADGMRLTDETGTIVMVNEAYCRLVRRPREELIGNPFTVVYRQEGISLDIALYRERFADQRVSIRTMAQITLWNGEKHESEISNSFVEFLSGQKLLLSIFRDVTAQKGAEAARLQTEERYRNLVESARDAIFTLSSGGLITSLNTAFESLTGWSTSDWLGRPIGELLHPADAALAGRTFENSRQGIQMEATELRIRTKGGLYRVGEFTVTPQRSGEKILGVLGIVRDVTERKQLEEQLRQSQKLEGIGTLAGGIAHDFNNILAIMLGYVSLLQQGDITAERFDKSIRALASAIQRGAALVRQLLTFARRSDITFEHIDVNRVLRDMARMLEATFPKTVEFDVRLDDAPANVLADESQLHQVFLNLCVNARDAMASGGVLSIRTARAPWSVVAKKFPEAPNCPYVEISIADSGAGMNEATRSRIFEPFFTTKEQGRGTGLGLAVAYGVIKSHGGYVGVESELKRGTRFFIYIPESQGAGKPESAEASTDDTSTAGSETILYAEDEETLAAVVKMILERNGYTVLVARDGKSAVDLFRENQSRVDLVLSDLGLPRLGGWGAILQMKEIKPNIDVIILSGYISPDQRTEFLRIGVREIIQKPYAPKDVLHIIRRVLDARHEHVATS